MPVIRRRVERPLFLMLNGKDPPILGWRRFSEWPWVRRDAGSDAARVPHQERF